MRPFEDGAASAVGDISNSECACLREDRSRPEGRSRILKKQMRHSNGAISDSRPRLTKPPFNRRFQEFPQRNSLLSDQELPFYPEGS